MSQIIADPKTAWENAYKVGELDPQMAHMLQDYTGEGQGAAGWIRLIGMRGTERFNRVVAVNAGINYGEKLASQAASGSGMAIRELERFGIKLSEIKNGQLDTSALLKIGRQVSGETQFSTKPGELPYFWRTNLGKIVTQFKSFAYKQTGFLNREFNPVSGRVSTELRQGNPLPLINSLVVAGIAAPIAGEILNDFKSLVRNKKRDDINSLTQRYFSNILAATSFGLFDSTGSLFGQYGEQGIISTLTGPTGGDIGKVTQAVADAAKGIGSYDPNKSVLDNLDPNHTTQRAVLKTIPAVGQTISNTIVPNSFITNYIGVNHGLNTKDEQKYQALLASDPAKAEAFRKANQASQAGGSSSGKATNDTGLKSQVKKTGKAATLSDGSVVYRDKNGAVKTLSMAPPTKGTGIGSFSNSNFNATKAVEIWNNESIPQDMKLQLFKKLGVDPQDARYAALASYSADVSTQYIISKSPDHQKLLNNIMTGRVVGITGKQFADNTVINNLVDQGYLSKKEGTMLKKIKVEHNGSLATSTLSALKGTGISASQFRARINALNTLSKNPIKTTSTKTPTIKTPKTPTLLASKPANSKTLNQWFTAY